VGLTHAGVCVEFKLAVGRLVKWWLFGGR
jgi:hypothetical protein